MGCRPAGLSGEGEALSGPLVSRRIRPDGSPQTVVLAPTTPVLLHHPIERGLLRLPPEIGRAGGLRLDAGRCLHIQELSARRPRKLPARPRPRTSLRLRVSAAAAQGPLGRQQRHRQQKQERVRPDLDRAQAAHPHLARRLDVGLPSEPLRNSPPLTDASSRSASSRATTS
jgi:hypothetical protein